MSVYRALKIQNYTQVSRAKMSESNYSNFEQINLGQEKLVGLFFAVVVGSHKVGNFHSLNPLRS